MNKKLNHLLAIFSLAIASCAASAAPVNVSPLSVDKPQWMPSPRQLTNTAVEKPGPVDLSPAPASPAAKSTATITVTKTTARQEIWGFGGSVTGPAKNFRQDLSAKTQNEAFDLLFSNEGDNLGLTIARLNIDPLIQPKPGQHNWAVDKDQAWFTQEAYKRYPCPITAVPWSPPAWMKFNNSLKDGSTDKTDSRLKPEHYATFAQWLYDWTYYYRDTHGLNIKWLSLQNEPNADVKWYGCHYSPKEMEKTVLAVLDLFRSKNSTVAIGAPECGHDQSAQEFIDAWSASTREKIDWLPHHGYKSIRQPQNDLDFSKYNKPVLMTELCGGPKPVNDLTIVDGLLWAGHIQRALSRNERGYLYWQLLRAAASPQSLLVLKSGKDVFIKSKRAFVFGQYSRFIRPGYIIVNAKSSDSALLITAAKHPSTGNTSVVIANKSDKDIIATITGLDGKTIGARVTDKQYDFAATKDIPASGTGAFTIKIPAMSVVSIAEK